MSNLQPNCCLEFDFQYNKVRVLVYLHEILDSWEEIMCLKLFLWIHATDQSTIINNYEYDQISDTTFPRWYIDRLFVVSDFSKKNTSPFPRTITWMLMKSLRFP